MSVSDFPAPIQVLLSRPGLPELGPGPRNGIVEVKELDQLLDPLLRSVANATLIRALLLLWNDHHDPAHELVQDASSRDGYLIHAILHRREPDFGNANYWFHRVGAHPCYPALASAVAKHFNETSKPASSETFLRRGAWDPLRFVAACEEVAGEPADSVKVTELRRIQGLETEVLLQHLLGTI